MTLNAQIMFSLLHIFTIITLDVTSIILSMVSSRRSKSLVVYIPPSLD